MAEFIDQIIGDQLASFSQEAFSGYESALPIYLHRLASQEEVYGGFALPQWIETVAMDAQLLEWLLASLWQLDQIIALDFYFYDHNNGSLIDLYLDTEIQIEQSSLVLGLATPNLYVSQDPAEPYEGRWWEIFINTPEFVHDSGQLKYALLHELGHAFGLEHPFDSSDGDAWGVEGGDPNGEVTVMSYTPSPEGWPSTYRPLDLAALASLWGLEPDHTDGWLFRNSDQSEQVLSSSEALEHLRGPHPAESLIGPVVLPEVDSLGSDLTLVPQQLVDSAVSTEQLLIPQGRHDTLFYAFDSLLDGDVLLLEAYERAINQLDQAIEIDFQRLDDPDSSLVQLVLSRQMLPVDRLEAGDLVAIERQVLDPELHPFLPERTTVLLDPLNPYYRHQSFFPDLSTALEFTALQGLLTAAGMSLPVPAVEIAPEQSLLGSRADVALAAVQLSALDLQSLELAYGPELTSGPMLDPTLSTVSIVDAAIDVIDAEGLSHLNLTFEREGSLDLSAAIHVQPSVKPAAVVEVVPSLDPQSLLFQPLQQQATLRWSIPSGQVDELQLAYLNPWQILLATENDSIDIHAAEFSLEPRHLVDHRSAMGVDRPMLDNQGSELLFWSAALREDSPWPSFFEEVVELFDQAIDLDFHRVPSDHPLAQLKIIESEHASVEGVWHQPELMAQGSTHALPPTFELVVPALSPDSDLEVAEKRLVIQQLLLALGLEEPTDFSDGDGYERTAVYPRDSGLYTHVDDDDSDFFGLTPHDRDALALVHGHEDDHSSGVDPLLGEPVIELVPRLSMQLDEERSGLNAQEDGLLVWVDVERQDNWQLDSQALVSLRLDGVLQPDTVFTMAAGQPSQSLQLEIPRLVDEAEISIYPIKGSTASSEPLLLGASQWGHLSSRSASSADASPPSSLFVLDQVVPESLAVGELVSRLGSVDPDADASFEYTLVSGEGDNDNDVFSIIADQLFLSAPLDYESKSEYTIRVRSTDSSGHFLEQSLQLMVQDVAELMFQAGDGASDLSFAPFAELDLELQLELPQTEIFLDHSHQLLLHYNSRDLVVLGGESLQLDVSDLDDDPSTDSFVIRDLMAGLSSPGEGGGLAQHPLSIRMLLDRFDPLTGQPSVTKFNYSISTPGLSTMTTAGSDLLTAFNLDVDGDGAVTPLGDGLMVIRKLFGDAFAGEALTAKAINAAAATRNSEQIHRFIEQGIAQGALDLDGDGRTTALGDGLMLIRRLFGDAFDGQALIDKALAADSPLSAASDASQIIAARVDALIAPVLR